MKINEHSAPAFITKAADNNAPKEDFEQWMNNPAGQNSGDEFYWLHQQQLQNSDLRFESLIQEQNNQPATADILKEQSTLLNQAEFVKPVASRPLPFIAEPTALFHPTDNSLRPLKKDPIHCSQKKNQQAIPSMPLLNINSKTHVPVTKEPKTPEHRAIPSPLKKHHLYIENQEVELSLNTQELNHHEEQELRQMIRLNIKGKGLSLKQLLINGVKK